jgi:hypothetical protein
MYALFPTVEVMEDVLRVYFTALDDQNVGRTKSPHPRIRPSTPAGDDGASVETWRVKRA